ncbi:flagellar biosynthesis protein FlgB [Nocardioides sp. Root190]|uniref:flagellar basal body rod protein FlgB n=1 Tax=Nocardioides sp. Root190 TaxID=1736488 RepID=UPI0006F7C857|nr:flagellar basal body rod protein FlgB [Nocardioides sp. Root190]KRB79952.1 flagellar biosynthesis protein FlgB [Nocardioides sp. Root190]
MSFAASDAVGFVLHTAITGLSTRQEVIADNIANVDTPGFRARSVEFESTLQRAIDRGRATTSGPGALGISVAATDTPVGANDNNVDLRKESIAAVQTQYQYQIMGRAISDRHSRLSLMSGGAA